MYTVAYVFERNIIKSVTIYCKWKDAMLQELQQKWYRIAVTVLIATVTSPLEEYWTWTATSLRKCISWC